LSTIRTSEDSRNYSKVLVDKFKEELHTEADMLF